MNAMSLRPLNAARLELGLPALSTVRDHLTSPLILGMDPALTPLPPDSTARGIRQTGYPWYDDFEPLPSDLEDFLSSGPRPIYLGFGSMIDPDDQPMFEIVLEATRMSAMRSS